MFWTLICVTDFLIPGSELYIVNRYKIILHHWVIY